LTLRITNLSSRQPFNYKSWSQRKTGVTISDQNRNYYNRVLLENPPIVEQTIAPGETINDYVVFEPPMRAFGYLDLDLPSHAYIPYLFRIPFMMAERVEAPKPVAVPEKRAQPAPAPPPQPPFDPETDPQIRSKVISDYRSGSSAIERKARGMGFDRGRKYKIEAYEKLLDEIGNTYNLTVDQVRRIVRR
jgi:hypothetical protein